MGRCVVVVDPPQPVRVTLLGVCTPPRHVVARGLPLWIRADGLDIAGTRDGVLLSWHRLITGDWFGLCKLTITSRTGRHTVTVHQLVPAWALQPADQR